MKNIISSILIVIGLSSFTTDHTGCPTQIRTPWSTSHILTDDVESKQVALKVSVAQQQGYAIGFGATRAGALGDAGKSLPKGAIRLKVSYTKEGKKWKCTIKYKPKK